MSMMVSQITGVSSFFFQLFIQAQIKENIKDPRHWPSWGESTCQNWNIYDAAHSIILLIKNLEI